MRARALITAAWVSTAVLAAHAVAYRLTYADPHARAHALSSSGHGWTSLLPVLLVAGALGAVVGTLVGAIRGHGPGTRRRELLTLVLGGTGAYTLVELGERLLHHGNLEGVLHDLSGGGLTTLVTGVLFILVTAPLFLLVRRGIEALVLTREPLTRNTAILHQPAGQTFVRQLFVGLEPTRGPPLARLG